MALLRVKNWAKFQHYKDRCPPWIKLATDTFQNYDFSRLQDASKLLAVCIWTLAARSQDGTLAHDFEYIKSQCCLGNTVKPEHLKELITQGFIEFDSSSLADCKQSACLEGETETEGETEKREKRATRIPPDFRVTDAHRKFAAEHGYPSPDSEIHKFIDHFKSKPGKDGTSLDWDARFRVWLSKAEKYGGRNGSGRQQQTYADKNQAATVDAVRAVSAKYRTVASGTVGIPSDPAGPTLDAGEARRLRAGASELSQMETGDSVSSAKN